MKMSKFWVTVLNHKELAMKISQGRIQEGQIGKRS